MRPRARDLAVVGAVSAAILLAGCVPPNVSPRTHTLENATVGLKGADVSPAPEWWLGLNDPQLNRIMSDALAGNPTLDDVLARLRLASAAVETQNAGLLPQIAIDAEEHVPSSAGLLLFLRPTRGATAGWDRSRQAFPGHSTSRASNMH
jgi:outer membrane protein TolC